MNKSKARNKFYLSLLSFIFLNKEVALEFSPTNKSTDKKSILFR